MKSAATLTASDPTGSDFFGTSVAVSGNTVVAGAYNHQVGAGTTQGAAYVFAMPTTGPWVSATQTAELTASDGQSGDELGYSVAISGTTIVTGARQRQSGGHTGQGTTYAYTEPAGGWVTTSAFAAELTAGDGDTVDNLGDSVAVSGTTIVAGAPRHDAESTTADFGAAYVFGPGSVAPPVVPPPVVPPRVVPPPGGSPDREGEIDLGWSRQDHRGALVPVGPRVRACEPEGHGQGAPEGPEDHGDHRRTQTQESSDHNEAGCCRLWRRDAGGGHEEDTHPQAQCDRASAPLEVWRAQGDRDRQLRRQGDQEGHRHGAQPAKPKKKK